MSDLYFMAMNWDYIEWAAQSNIYWGRNACYYMKSNDFAWLRLICVMLRRIR